MAMVTTPSDLQNFIDQAMSLAASIHIDAFPQIEVAGSGCAHFSTRFPTAAAARKFSDYLVALKNAHDSLSNSAHAAATMIEPSKPLQIEIRQWAMKRVLQGRTWPYDEVCRLRVKEAADELVAYVMNGRDAA